MTKPLKTEFSPTQYAVTLTSKWTGEQVKLETSEPLSDVELDIFTTDRVSNESLFGSSHVHLQDLLSCFNAAQEDTRDLQELQTLREERDALLAACEAVEGFSGGDSEEEYERIAEQVRAAIKKTKRSL